MSVDLLNQLACEFRSALEIVVNEKQYGRLKIFGSFPNECCRYTSDLLAEYLVNNDIARKRIQMVESETLEEEYTHCWLMIDSTLFVDITADQFNKSPYFRKYAPIPACCVVPLDTYLY